ncbi:MAG: VapE family protein [Negativicutes bacterium]|nr:VapE family protein [Negativicutes bacterium]
MINIAEIPTPILDSALDYANRGWPVFPLHAPRLQGDSPCSCGNRRCDSIGKHPRTPNGVKDATTDSRRINKWWEKWPTSNVGIATGKPSGFWVIDEDGEEGRQTMADLERDYGPLPQTGEAVTGGGGRHRLFKWDGTHIPNSQGKLGPGVDIRGDGGYIAAAPSWHRSGRYYKWAAGFNPDDVSIADAPAWLVALATNTVMTKKQEVPEEIPEGSRNDTLFRMGCSLRDKGYSFNEILALLETANLERCCPPMEDREVETIARSASRYEPKHPIMSANTTDMVASLEKIIDKADQVSFFEQNIKPAMAVLSEIERESHVKRIAKALSVPPKTIRDATKPIQKATAAESWTEEFEPNQFGDPKACAHNFLLVLKNDPAFKGICLNELSSEIEFKKGSDTTVLDDIGEAMIRVHIDREYDLRGAALCRDALVWEAHEHAYHPIREYIERLPAWDGVVRAETIFIDGLGAVDSKYNRHIIKMVLKAAYERVHQPGVKFDLILVLRGPQGIGKSVLISKLGMRWSHSSLRLTDMRDSKVAGEKIQGYWIIEIPELAGMTNADLESTKAFITATEDVYRAAYDRKTARHKRQSIMIATTNAEGGYLRDETGGRRFLDMFCAGNGKLPPMQLTLDYIDQVWAEVKETYMDVPIYLSGDDLAQATADQLAQVEQDPREDIVAEYLGKPIPSSWYKMTLYQRQAFLEEQEDRQIFPEITGPFALRQVVCTAEVFEEAFRLNKGQMQPKDKAAITRILMRLGWTKFEGKRRCGAYGSMRGFQRP